MARAEASLKLLLTRKEKSWTPSSHGECSAEVREQGRESPPQLAAESQSRTAVIALIAHECGPVHSLAGKPTGNARGREYPRQGENKPGFTREKRKGRGSGGAQSGTTKRAGRRGQVKTAKTAKKANGRKGGAR